VSTYCSSWRLQADFAREAIKSHSSPVVIPGSIQAEYRGEYVQGVYRGRAEALAAELGRCVVAGPLVQCGVGGGKAIYARKKKEQP
jgi:hypothetical protein